MGHNATVVVMLDALKEISEDALFGEKLSDAILSMNAPKAYRKGDVSARSADGRSIHCNAATVIEQHHADQTVLVAVGGNCGTALLQTYGWGHSSEEDKLRLLRAFAEDCGYYISRKPKKAKN
jgi:hypothetical protein